MKIIKIIKDNNTLLLFVSRKQLCISDFKEIFIKQCGTKKESFTHKYMLRIFDALFKCSLNLNEEYNEFYKYEYKTFSEFLYKKEMISNILIEQIKEDYSENFFLLKLAPEIYNYNFLNLYNYEENSRFIENINSMFVNIEKELYNEN
jgi:hypothetical protein